MNTKTLQLVAIYRVHQWIGRFGNGIFLFLGWVWKENGLLDGVAVNSVQFDMESWTGARRAFAVKSFYKNNDSYVAAQREFRKKFDSSKQ